jgi:hypothetical protein
MGITDFRPKAGDFGEQHIAVSRTLPTAWITASNTVRHILPITASDVDQANATDMYYYKGGALTVGSGTSNTAGTVTARVVKRNAAGTFIPISSTRTIPTGTTAGTVFTFPRLDAVTADQRTVRPQAGDTLWIEVVASSTVTTPPGDTQAALKLAVLR